jgi:predicted nucleotidyltransferase
MKPSEALAIHRVELRQLVSYHNFMRPRVLGSMLAGTDTEESDLDLLVDRREKTTLFALFCLKYQAEELPGVRVSVLTPKFLPERFRDKVLQQAQPL